MMDVWKLLAEPFNPATIKWRVGATSKDKSKGIALAYVDARIVMVRMDDVVGPDNWQDEYFETASGRIMCRLSIRINGEWITKTDGAGDTGTEGEKGAISDAFKRAAVKFGIGRYLYALPNTWVALDQYRKLTSVPQLPDWALPKQHDISILQAIDTYYDEIVQMRASFEEGDLEACANVWFTIPHDPDDVDHQSLLVRTAPTRGGIIETQLRNFLMTEASKYRS